jgi:hypothetical protein
MEAKNPRHHRWLSLRCYPACLKEGEEQVETRNVEGQRSKLKKLTVGVQFYLQNSALVIVRNRCTRNIKETVFYTVLKKIKWIVFSVVKP